MTVYEIDLAAKCLTKKEFILEVHNRTGWDEYKLEKIWKHLRKASH